MNLAVCLFAYAMALSVFGPPVLAQLTDSGAAPRLGVAVWLAAMGSVLAAGVGALVVFVGQLLGSWDHIGRVLTGCVVGLRLIAAGGYGAALQAILLGLAAVAVTALVVLAGRVAISLRRCRLHTREHARRARIAAGDTSPGPGGALVVDSAQPAVYCLGGRPRTIVVTQAALRALTDAQLDAVLAHEQAHLSGRHHPLLALTRALSTILPGLRLFTEGHSQIARLLEMCADDAAARRHSRDTVVDALLALALPTPHPPGAAALGAAGLGVAQRVERLLFPPDSARARISLTLTLAAGLLGPAIAVAVMLAASPTLCGR
jgi:Zn-dependent protease with chaperone function